MENLRCSTESLTRARVLAQYRGLWLVASDEETQLVPARGRLTETPVTGDWVGLDDGGAIAAVFERHGAIVRRAPGDRSPAATCWPRTSTSRS